MKIKEIDEEKDRKIIQYLRTGMREKKGSYERYRKKLPNILFQTFNTE